MMKREKDPLPATSPVYEDMAEELANYDLAIVETKGQVLGQYG
jgi:hypothetical protein